jgi:drug/metabolite transporter (DMT)-like permease
MIAVVAFGLGAAIVYGVSDFFGAFAARRIHLVTATLFNYAVATVAIVIVVWILGGVWSPGAILWGSVCGVLAVFGLLAFYGVLAIGPMSLLSPVIAMIQSVVPVAAAVITGQALTPLAWVAIAIGLVALLLLAPRPQPGRTHITPRAAILAVASGLLLGVSLTTLDFAPHNSGVVPSVLEIVAGLVVLAVVWLVLRLLPNQGGGTLAFLQPGPDAVATLSARRAWIAAAASGVLVAIADAFIILDLHIGNLAVVSVLVALYPVLTVILAATVLKERMSKLQFVAVALVIVASLLFSSTS